MGRSVARNGSRTPARAAAQSLRQIDALLEQGARAPSAVEESHAPFVHDVQRHLGNTRVQSALRGEGDLLDGLVHEVISLGAGGVSVASGLESLLPNHVVNALLAGASLGAGDMGGLVGAGGVAAGVVATQRAPGYAEDEAGASLSLDAVERATGRAGAPLPEAVRVRLERALGVADLSVVRIHTDAAAARAAESISARAFALGPDIYFGEGTWNPDSDEGLRLLAHEATHVLQYVEGRLPTPQGEGLQLTSPGDAVEVEAEAAADAAVPLARAAEVQDAVEPDAAGPALGEGSEADGTVAREPGGTGQGSGQDATQGEGKKQTPLIRPELKAIAQEAFKQAMSNTGLFREVRGLASLLRYFGITDIQSVSIGVVLDANAILGPMGGDKGLNLQFFFAPSGELLSAGIYGFTDEGQLDSFKSKYTIDEYMKESNPIEADKRGPTVLGYFSAGASIGVSVALRFGSQEISDMAASWEGDFYNFCVGKAGITGSIYVDKGIFKGNGGWVGVSVGGGLTVGFPSLSTTTYTGFELGPDVLGQIGQIGGELIEELQKEQNGSDIIEIFPWLYDFIFGEDDPKERSPSDAAPTQPAARPYRPSPGAALPTDLRDPLESSFGADLSEVRVHDDPGAHDAASSVGALAFTQGADISFGAGQYNPRSRGGLQLLAHEITHTLQSSGPTATEQVNGQTVSSPGARNEQEADTVADEIVAAVYAALGQDPAAQRGAPVDGVALSTVADRAAQGPATQALARRAAQSGPASSGAAQRAAGGGDAALAFLDLAPSKQASRWTGLADEVNAGVQNELTETRAALPELHAALGQEGGSEAADGADTLEAAPTTGANADLTDTSTGVEPPPPDTTPPNIPSQCTPAPAVTEPAADQPEQGGQTFRSALTALPKTASDVPKEAGDPSPLDHSGDADPARADATLSDAKTQAQDAAQDARDAVERGRGPEAVQPITLDEAFAVNAALEASELALNEIPGMARFLDWGIPQDVSAAMDGAVAEQVTGALAGARQQITDAIAGRDQGQQAMLDEATADARQLVSDAESDQRAEVSGARDQILAARRDAIDGQRKAVEDLELRSGERHDLDTEAMQTRIDADQGKIDDAFEGADRDINDAVSDAEKDADKEKQKAAEDSEDSSWWDRFKSRVKAAIQEITNAVNAIFNELRSAVKGLIEDVKKLACDLIDKARDWLKDKVRQFGDWLKTQVNALLAEHFPELAEKLNNAIDEAVDRTCEKIDNIAEDLKADVVALCDKVGSYADSVLSFFQTGINFGLAVAEGVLTGEWDRAGKMVLEGVLSMIGVSPEEFWAFVGQAKETLDRIADEPGVFVSNLVAGVQGGFGRFSDNFLTHLEGGFITWITGTLSAAGVTLPGTWDLAGVFDLTCQVLGLTKDHLREKVAEHLGETGAAAFTFVWDTISAFVSGGWAGLWEQISGQISGLWDMVVGGIKNFLYEQIAKKIVTKIATLFVPGGAIVELISTAWNLYKFVRDQLSRISAIVQSVVATVTDIANGNTAATEQGVENALAGLVPVAIDLLAKLLGLGGLPDKIRTVIEGIREQVDHAIDWLIEKVLGLFGGGGQEEEDHPDKEDGEIAEPFQMDGEPHTLFIGLGEDAAVEMASVRGDVVGKAEGLIKKIQDKYAESEGNKDERAKVDLQLAHLRRIASKAQAVETAATALTAKNASDIASADLPDSNKVTEVKGERDLIVEIASYGQLYNARDFYEGASSQSPLVLLYQLLGDTPGRIDIPTNDIVFKSMDAHTDNKHGPDTTDSFHENRLKSSNWDIKASSKWYSYELVNEETNLFIQRSWEWIRSTLAFNATHEFEHTIKTSRELGKTFTMDDNEQIVVLESRRSFRLRLKVMDISKGTWGVFTAFPE